MRAGTIVALAVGAGLTAAAFMLPRIAERKFGKVYSIEQTADLKALRRIAYACTPLIEAVEEQIAQGGSPQTLKEIRNLPPAFMSDMELLRFSRSGVDYVLYYKLNWDAGLYYSSTDGMWEYDSGLQEGRVSLWERSSKRMYPPLNPSVKVPAKGGSASSEG